MGRGLDRSTPPILGSGSPLFYAPVMPTELPEVRKSDTARKAELLKANQRQLALLTWWAGVLLMMLIGMTLGHLLRGH
jgi:hypothetical protein